MSENDKSTPPPTPEDSDLKVAQMEALGAKYSKAHQALKASYQEVLPLFYAEIDRNIQRKMFEAASPELQDHLTAHNSNLLGQLYPPTKKERVANVVNKIYSHFSPRSAAKIFALAVSAFGVNKEAALPENHPQPEPSKQKIEVAVDTAAIAAREAQACTVLMAAKEHVSMPSDSLNRGNIPVSSNKVANEAINMGF